MNFFESRYFNVNKRMLILLGLWPYQDGRSKTFKCILTIITISIFIIPQVMSIFKNTVVNINITLQSTVTALYLFFVLMKYFITAVTEDKMLELYENIDNNWKKMKGSDEMQTLAEHSETGRFLTIAYIIYVSFAGLSFISTPTLPPLINKLFVLNESLPTMFIFEGEYSMDRYEHYKKVFIFEACACIFSMVIVCTVDTTYAVCVHHCIALMNIVRLRLDTVNRSLHQAQVFKVCRRDSIHTSVVEIIGFHQKALKLSIHHFVTEHSFWKFIRELEMRFANVLESSYSLNFFIVVGGTVCCLSIGSTLILLNLHIPIQMFRHSMIMIGFMVHMFYLSLPGQQLIDACIDLSKDICSSKWYAFPTKTRKDLYFTIMATKEPRQITAGGLYAMNMENFGMLVKTSLSYITVFASFL